MLYLSIQITLFVFYSFLNKLINLDFHLFNNQGFCFGFVEFEVASAVQSAIEVFAERILKSNDGSYVSIYSNPIMILFISVCVCLLQLF